MDKKKIIEEYLFDGNIEEKFELDWDIWENFEEIKKDRAKKHVFEPLANKIKNELLKDPFQITMIDWGSIYIAKPKWQEGNKDRGIYALCVEKLDRSWPSIGIVRNKQFTTELEKQMIDMLSRQGFRSTQWFLGYIPIPDWKYSDLKEYYKIVFFNPKEIVDFFFNYFKQVYEVVTGMPELEQLLDRSVEARKKQIYK